MTEPSFDPRDPVALTQALIRCPSVTPAEGGAIALLDGILPRPASTTHRLTFSEPGTPDVENLYARRGRPARRSSSPAMSTSCRRATRRAGAIRPFAGEIAGGEICGRGAVDMKGGVAASVAAALRHSRRSAGARSPS